MPRLRAYSLHLHTKGTGMENRNPETTKPEKLTGKEKAAVAALYTGAAAAGLGAGVLVRQAFYAAAGVCWQIVRAIVAR